MLVPFSFVHQRSGSSKKSIVIRIIHAGNFFQVFRHAGQLLNLKQAPRPFTFRIRLSCSELDHAGSSAYISAELKPDWMKNLSTVVCCVVVLTALLPITLKAQEERNIGPVSKTYAITNVTIVQAPGRKIDMGMLVIKDGLIKAVGKNLSIPPEAIVIKADSMYVYAGFIDGLSRAGVVKSREESKEKVKDPGNPPSERAGITPQQDVRNFLNPSEKSVEEMRALGFTTAHVVPYGGMLPGNGSIILLGGKSADAMVLVPKTSFYSELTVAERVYPNTVIGVMAKYRELYKQASQAKAYESLYASNRAGLEHPASDRILESFYPVIEKHMPVLFKAERALDVHRVLNLQHDLGFTLMLADVKEGWDVTNKIKASGAKTFLSLDLPEEKKKDEKKDGDKKPEESKPVTATVEEKEALEKKKAEFMARYVGQPVAFQQAGIPFGFSTLSAKTKDIQANLRRMITAGLTEDQALAALTTTPASLLGLSDRMGSIDVGKMANLVISYKPYFNEKSKVRYVFVDGVLYKQEVKEEKKDEATKKVEIEGEWKVIGQTQQGKGEALLVIRKEGDKYSGKISGDNIPQPVDLTTITLEGSKLKFSFVLSGPEELKIEVEVTVEGDSFKGDAQVGPDKLPVEGKKNPKINH